MTDLLRRLRAASPAPGWVLLLACLVQWPLLLNPGYFSHDELQWAARAAQGAWFDWGDTAAFQYRPLTFTVWEALSRLLFAMPIAFHAVLVLWGSANAALLCAVARRLGLQPWPAALGALAFALSPYATYVHGWVGCIGDLLWLSGALLVAWCALRARRVGTVVAATVVLMAAALLAKEAALAIPALAAVAWWFDPARRPRWRAVVLASGAVAFAFLALRANALLHAPREGAQYALDAAHVPLRWIEYQLFAPMVPSLEAFTLFNASVTKRIIVAALLWFALVHALWRADRRLCAVFLVGGVAALAPVLPLGSSWNHYAYGFAALAAPCVAAAWPRASRAGRAAIALFAVLVLLHGAVVMLAIREVGRVQAMFSPALARAVAAHGNTPLRLRVAPDAKAWIFARLTHDIPEYDGVPIGNRVQLVGADAPADGVITREGRVLLR